MEQQVSLTMNQVRALVEYGASTQRALGGPPTDKELASFLGRMLPENKDKAQGI